MTPAERRTAAIRLLAQLDQQIAECEMLPLSPSWPTTNWEWVLS